MRFERIFGWILILMGVGIILGTIYYSKNVFFGKARLPEIFEFEKKEKEQVKKKIPTSLEDIQKQIEGIISKKLEEILPSEVIFKFFNLISFSILAGILIFGGSQIATLGIRLIK